MPKKPIPDDQNSSKFDIVTPDQDEVRTANANSTLFVQVFNRNSDYTGFVAEISDIATGETFETVILTNEPTSQRWSANNVKAGTIPQTDPGRNNKTITVTALEAGSVTGDSQSNDFDLSFSGSGSGKFIIALPLDMEGRLVPVALQLQLDSPVRPGTCSNCDQLNGPILLVHSDDVEFSGCWFSQPIELCADGTGPAFWMLQTKNSKTWTLLLRHNEVHVATYRFTSGTEKNLPFPMKLQIVGSGGKECKNWPRTVTIVPAP